MTLVRRRTGPYVATAAEGFDPMPHELCDCGHGFGNHISTTCAVVTCRCERWRPTGDYERRMAAWRQRQHKGDTQ